MNVSQRNWLRLWLIIRKWGAVVGVAILVLFAILVGLWIPSNHSFIVCLLLLVFVTLASWVRGWREGVAIGILASIITAPYDQGTSSLIHPALDMGFWMPLSICYLLTGALTGARGNAYRHLERENEELALLNTIASTTNTELDISEVQVTALAHIGSMLSPDTLQLYNLDSDGQSFILKIARPSLPETSDPVILPGWHALVKRIIDDPKVLLVESDDELKELRPPMVNDRIRHMVAVPLTSNGQVIAIVLLGRRLPQPFSEEDIHFLESMRRLLTVAIDNAERYHQAQELSYTDDLTGLGNRRMFNVRLAHEIERAQVSRGPLWLVMFDLDHFKRVNDEYGHPAGDEVLKQFALRVQELIRGNDAFCRIGGEEFALVVIGTTPSGITAIAQRICCCIANSPFALPDGHSVFMTVSAGIAGYNADTCNTSAALLEAADKALYTAKQHGRNRAEFSCIGARRVSMSEGT